MLIIRNPQNSIGTSVGPYISRSQPLAAARLPVGPRMTLFEGPARRCQFSDQGSGGFRGLIRESQDGRYCGDFRIKVQEAGFRGLL